MPKPASTSRSPSPSPLPSMASRWVVSRRCAPSSGTGPPRRDFSAFFRDKFERFQLTDPQAAALKWLMAQPNAPAKMLVISEDWSSDCRRDVPVRDC